MSRSFNFRHANFGLASPLLQFQNGRSGGANLPPDATARTIFRIGCRRGAAVRREKFAPVRARLKEAQCEEGVRFVSVKLAGGSSLDAMERGALQSAWESIRSGLRRDCGARTFDGWLRP